MSHPRDVKVWCEGVIRRIALLHRAERFVRILRSSNEGEIRCEELATLPSLHHASAAMLALLRIFGEDAFREFFYR